MGILSPSAEAVVAAEAVGFPVLIKATGGGGGMGIYKCFTVEEVTGAFSLAVSQGTKSFGNGDVFVEKYIQRSKHIEVQVCSAVLAPLSSCARVCFLRGHLCHIVHHSCRGAHCLVTVFVVQPRQKCLSRVMFETLCDNP